MERNLYTQQRRQRARDPLERRMDQLVATGKQFVDGVSGNRPGQRRKDNRYGLNNMGRWVENKIDWFFEEEEDNFSDSNRVSNKSLEDNAPVRKRPLTAISLRVPKALAASIKENNEINSDDEWPDDASFRVDRWERDRTQVQQLNKSSGLTDTKSEKIFNRRPLPRSSRRRI